MPRSRDTVRASISSEVRLKSLKNQLLRTMSTSNLLEEAQDPENLDTLAPELAAASQSLTLQSFPTESEEISQLLSFSVPASPPLSGTLSTLDANGEWRGWWLKQVNEMFAVLINNKDREQTFLRDQLRDIFSYFDECMSDARKVSLEDCFRHGYIKRFGELVLNYLVDHNLAARDYYTQLISALVEETNANIYHMILCLYDIGGGAANTRLFNLCSSHNLESVPYEISDIAIFLKNATAGLDITDNNQEAINEASLVVLDPHHMWRSWLAKKVPLIVDYFCTIDQLTGETYEQLICTSIGVEDDLSSRVNIALAYMVSYLGQLRIDAVKKVEGNGDFYISKLVEAFRKEFEVPDSHFMHLVKENFIVADFRKNIRAALSSEALLENSPKLNELKDLINAKLEMLNDQNAEQNDLTEILHYVHDILFSLDNPHEDFKSGKFFMSSLLEEQIADEQNSKQKLYSRYQTICLKTIVEEVVEKFKVKFSGTAIQRVNEIGRSFITNVRNEHMKKATAELQDILELYSNVASIAEVIDDADTPSKMIKQSLEDHMQMQRNEYVETYASKCWLPPITKTEMLEKTSLENATFFDKNDAAFGNAPQLKSLVHRFLDYIFTRLKALLHRNAAKTPEDETTKSQSEPKPHIEKGTTTPAWLQPWVRKQNKMAQKIILSHPPLVHSRPC